MSKYDFALDLDSENSLSMIIKMIKPNSKVLEFGPAYGRLTKYLYENMGCTIDIVEIDEKSGSEASKYANRSFIGNKLGNIENYIWLENLKNEKYDFIVFADVLEHLYWPENVLKKSKNLLKEDGSILLSVPNISHNSIIIDLINDEFKYSQTGLLDNTHIRFFTYKSLIRMLNTVGLVAVKERGIFNRVGDNEISNSYDCVEKEVARSLKNRDKANLYQFVFETKKSQYYLSNSALRSINLEKNSEHHILFYIKSNEKDEYTDSKMLIKNIFPNSVNENIELRDFGFIHEIKVYPIRCNCIIKNIKLYKVKNGVREEAEISYTNHDVYIDKTYIFRSQHPQLYIRINDEIDELIIKYEIVDYSTDKIDWIVNILEKEDSRKDAYIENLNIELSKKDAYIENLNIELSKKDAYIENLNIELSKKDAYIENLNIELSKKDTYIENLNIELTTMYDSIIWKMIKKIKK